MERRDFFATAATAMVATALTPSFASTKEKKEKMEFSEYNPKPLPFDPKKLNGISEKLIQSHWENNYIGAVKTLNSVKKKLAEIPDAPPFLLNGVKREQLMRNGSIVYHEMYFGNLGGNGKADNDIQKILKNDFGSFGLWESEFKKMGQGLSGGSGWVVLGYNLNLGMLENYWCWDHMHAPISTMPILVMDMYEHSYQMDYGAAAAKYIDAFFQNINWEEVNSRIEKSKKIKWI